MDKKILIAILIFWIVMLIPIIPTEREIQTGVVVIETRSIYSIVKEGHEKSTRVGTSSSRMLEMRE